MPHKIHVRPPPVKADWRSPRAVHRPLPARPRVGLSQGGPSRCGTAVSCVGRPPVRIQSLFQVDVRTTTIGDEDTTDRLGKYKDGCFGSGVGKGRVGGGRNRETGEHGGSGRGHVSRGGGGSARDEGAEARVAFLLLLARGGRGGVGGRCRRRPKGRRNDTQGWAFES